MKTINIYGDNKHEQSTKYREACRGIVLKEDKMCIRNKDESSIKEIGGVDKK